MCLSPSNTCCSEEISHEFTAKGLNKLTGPRLEAILGIFEGVDSLLKAAEPFVGVDNLGVLPPAETLETIDLSIPISLWTLPTDISSNFWPI